MIGPDTAHDDAMRYFGSATKHSRSAHTHPMMRTPYATINVRNLRLRTYIGFNPEEMAKQQDVVINIEIEYRMPPAVFEDEVAKALNYKTITKAVIEHVEEGRFLLLERLVGDVLAICCDHSSVHYARVSIDKPHALRFADSVSLTLEYNRHDPHDREENKQ